MTAPVLDARPHASAIKAALKSALGRWDAYEFGELNDATLPHIFALIAIERRYVAPERQGRSGRSGWRVEVRYVGRSINEARWAEAKVAQALDGARLMIGGYQSTPFAHESTAAIAPDDGRFSGQSFYTYAL